MRPRPCQPARRQGHHDRGMVTGELTAAEISSWTPSESGKATRRATTNCVWLMGARERGGYVELENKPRLRPGDPIRVADIDLPGVAPVGARPAHRQARDRRPAQKVSTKPDQLQSRDRAPPSPTEASRF
jgi:hypothetical protein